MSRKSLDESQRSSKSPTFNSLVKDLENPRTLMTSLPEDARTAACLIPEEYLNQDEETLLDLLEARFNFKPTNTIEALRNNFWLEFDRINASRTETVMNMSNIYLGVCTRDYWNKITVGQPHVYAYILTRSAEYEAVMAGMMSLSSRKLRDILNIPLMKRDGTPQDSKLIEIVLKAIAMVDLRNKGGIVQRSETKNLTLMEQRKTSYSTVFTAASADGTPKTAAQLQNEMDKKIRELEDEAMKATPPAFMSNVTVQGSAPVTKTPLKDEAVDADYTEVGGDERR